MTLAAWGIALLMAGAAMASADAGRPASGPQVPTEVAEAARAIALSGARPARLTTPMRGVRQVPFLSSRLWVIDSGQMNDSSLCGTGGCDVQFWLRRPDGRHIRIFDQRVLSYTIVGAATAQPVVHIAYHGSLCGAPGNAECAMAYRWISDADAPAGRLVVEPTDEGRGVLAGPLIAAVPPDRRRIPTLVAATLAGLDRQCRASGGRSAASADELPDLDGDERVEWATGGHAFFYTEGERVIERPCGGKLCSFAIFASAGGGVHRAYEGTGMAYLVSYERTRVRLLVVPLVDSHGSTSAGFIKALVFSGDRGAVRIAP